MYDNIELQHKTEKWLEERKITINGNAGTQTLKLMEEVGELTSEIVRGNFKDNEFTEGQTRGIKDALGDIMVLVTGIAKLSGTDLNEAWNFAYNEIKDRKGHLTTEGNFVKEEDL